MLLSQDLDGGYALPLFEVCFIKAQVNYCYFHELRWFEPTSSFEYKYAIVQKRPAFSQWRRCLLTQFCKVRGVFWPQSRTAPFTKSTGEPSASDKPRVSSLSDFAVGFRILMELPPFDLHLDQSLDVLVRVQLWGIIWGFVSLCLVDVV